jgi:diaminopimelate epimerase
MSITPPSSSGYVKSMVSINKDGKVDEACSNLSSSLSHDIIQLRQQKQSNVESQQPWTIDIILDHFRYNI